MDTILFLQKSFMKLLIASFFPTHELGAAFIALSVRFPSPTHNT
jgi:hypothetical protein